MNIQTHQQIDPGLCGSPVSIGPGTAEVRLTTTMAMCADGHGLVHGGFVFGLADYAAMLAVNDPNVVLGSAQTRFVSPVRDGETILARAKTTEVSGRKHTVEVTAMVADRVVMSGIFTTFVLDAHVLS